MGNFPRSLYRHLSTEVFGKIPSMVIFEGLLKKFLKTNEGFLFILKVEEQVCIDKYLKKCYSTGN